MPNTNASVSSAVHGLNRSFFIMKYLAGLQSLKVNGV
jgi:hypothetical protein